MKKQKNRLIILVGIFFVILLWSGINPHDYFTWILEVAPAIVGLIILAFAYPRFKFTMLVYYLVLIHSIILMVGGHYTYAQVPLFDYIQELFDLSRNHYDRIGHLAQGFFPAIVAREILIRTSPLKSGKWLFVIIVSICLAISAFYELIEWWVAALTGTAANDFLGSQGDVWDSQWDMFLAFIGSIASLLLLSKLHDKQLKMFKLKS